MVDKNCHKTQFVTISGVTVSGKHCTHRGKGTSLPRRSLSMLDCAKEGCFGDRPPAATIINLFSVVAKMQTLRLQIVP